MLPVMVGRTCCRLAVVIWVARLIEVRDGDEREMRVDNSVHRAKTFRNKMDLMKHERIL